MRPPTGSRGTSGHVSERDDVSSGGDNRLKRSLSEVHQTQRQVKSLLNKMTRDTFERLYAKLFDCYQQAHAEAQDEIIVVVAQEVFAKATTQHSFIEMYADVCLKLSQDLPEEGVQKRFRHALLDQCQKSFNLHLEPPRTRQDLDKEDQFEELIKYKTRMLGNVRLIGQLLRRKILAARIIFTCADELLTIASPEALETLCAFLETVGATFDTAKWQGHARLEGIFMRIEAFAGDQGQCSRTRCLLLDLLEKRKNIWRDRRM